MILTTILKTVILSVFIALFFPVNLSEWHKTLVPTVFFFFSLNFFNVFYLFLAMLGLRHFALAFSSCGRQGLTHPSSVRASCCRASLVAEHRPLVCEL